MRSRIATAAEERQKPDCCPPDTPHVWIPPENGQVTERTFESYQQWCESFGPKLWKRGNWLQLLSRKQKAGVWMQQHEASREPSPVELECFNCRHRVVIDVCRPAPEAIVKLALGAEFPIGQRPTNAEKHKLARTYRVLGGLLERIATSDVREIDSKDYLDVFFCKMRYAGSAQAFYNAYAGIRFVLLRILPYEWSDSGTFVRLRELVRAEQDAAGELAKDFLKEADIVGAWEISDGDLVDGVLPSNDENTPATFSRCVATVTEQFLNILDFPPEALRKTWTWAVQFWYFEALMRWEVEGDRWDYPECLMGGWGLMARNILDKVTNRLVALAARPASATSDDELELDDDLPKSHSMDQGTKLNKCPEDEDPSKSITISSNTAVGMSRIRQQFLGHQYLQDELFGSGVRNRRRTPTEHVVLLNTELSCWFNSVVYLMFFNPSFRRWVTSVRPEASNWQETRGKLKELSADPTARQESDRLAVEFLYTLQYLYVYLSPRNMQKHAFTFLHKLRYTQWRNVNSEVEDSQKQPPLSREPTPETPADDEPIVKTAESALKIREEFDQDRDAQQGKTEAQKIREAYRKAENQKTDPDCPAYFIESLPRVLSGAAEALSALGGGPIENINSLLVPQRRVFQVSGSANQQAESAVTDITSKATTADTHGPRFCHVSLPPRKTTLQIAVLQHALFDLTPVNGTFQAIEKYPEQLVINVEAAQWRTGVDGDTRLHVPFSMDFGGLGCDEDSLRRRIALDKMYKRVEELRQTDLRKLKTKLETVRDAEDEEAVHARRLLDAISAAEGVKDTEIAQLEERIKIASGFILKERIDEPPLVFAESIATISGNPRLPDIVAELLKLIDTAIQDPRVPDAEVSAVLQEHPGLALAEIAGWTLSGNTATYRDTTNRRWLPEIRRMLSHYAPKNLQEEPAFVKDSQRIEQSNLYYFHGAVIFAEAAAHYWTLVRNREALKSVAPNKQAFLRIDDIAKDTAGGRLTLPVPPEPVSIAEVKAELEKGKRDGYQSCRPRCLVFVRADTIEAMDSRDMSWIPESLRASVDRDNTWLSAQVPE
eukprot:Hpha_TRINITY_DN555_c0_g1::TRINITY_DN555_c0_g1_i2::g.171803::m.171803